MGNYQCPYCKRSQPIIKDGDQYFLPMHAKNPKKPILGHCNGAGMEIWKLKTKKGEVTIPVIDDGSWDFADKKQ